jgi:hypothetical protein
MDLEFALLKSALEAEPFFYTPVPKFSIEVP